MRIKMRDGRVFEGTALQIVQAMKSIAFGVEGMSLSEYADWVAVQARRFEGVELQVLGETEDGRAASLVDSMLANGLATRA